MLKSIFLICALALVYFIVGKLGLLLAVPPGFATAIWPASGIAQAALLVLGEHLWPGILIGSAAVNLFTVLEKNPDLNAMNSVFIPLMIGLGASLQAYIGTKLVRRFVGFPNQLIDYKSILKFLLIVGPISCLINPSLSVTFLFANDIVSSSNFFDNWGTWWTGDVMGSMIFSPAFCILGMTLRGNDKNNRIYSITIPLVVTFSLVISFFFWLRPQESGTLPVSNWAQLTIAFLFTSFLETLLLISTGQTLLVEQVVKERTEELKSTVRMATLGEMVAGITHEINNPLAAMQATLFRLKNAVLSKQIQDPVIDQSLASLDKIFARIQSTIKTMKYYSRSSETDPLEPHSFQSILQDWERICQDELQLKNISFSTNMPKLEVNIPCRPGQILQVLLNITSIISKSSSQKLADRWLEVELKETEEKVSIAIKSENSEKIVGKNQTSLNISKQIIAAHHGSLRIEQTQHFARYEIELPKASAEALRLSA